MLILVLILFTTICIEFCTAKCSGIPSGLYCTNLGNGTDIETLIFPNGTEPQKYDIHVVYLRNSSGKISQETFLNFSKVTSLDIQFSSIDNFSPQIITMDTLYLMYNSKFPTLTPELMKRCCQNLSILFIVGNNGLSIETGAFRHMENLIHLTISKQNITNLTTGFFKGLENITYLNLKENGILNIDENAFEKLKDLNHLILSNNNFTKFEKETFQNLKSLEALELHDLNFTEFNISIFNHQTELKVLGLPTKLVKTELELNEVTKIFPKLETFGFQNEDKEDAKVSEFINKCKASGYNIKFSNISDL